MSKGRELVPWAMAAGRAALGPALFAAQRARWDGAVLAGMVVTALVSDIFDGVLARRWGCDTAAVRLFDTLADTFFYAWTAVTLWFAVPGVWHDNRWLMLALLGLEGARLAFDFAKFGKPASYHSYLAKTWGLVMAAGVTATFWEGRANGLVPVALLLGVACDVEGLAMSVMLPVWRRDLKTVAAAWRVRREMRALCDPAHAPSARA